MKSRRVLIPLALAILIGVGAFELLDGPTRIEYYRLGDNDRTVIVGTTSGPNAWVRVTNVSETPTAVTITVRTFFVQLGPSTALGYPYESTVTLDAPLDGRSVVDGTGDTLVHRATCAPPALSSSPCP